MGRRNSVRRSSIVSSNKELRQDFRRQSLQGSHSRRTSLGFNMIDNNPSFGSASNVSGVSQKTSRDDEMEAVFIDADKHRDNMNAMLKMMGSRAKIEKRKPGSRNVSLAVEEDSSVEDEGEETSLGVFSFCCSRA